MYRSIRTTSQLKAFASLFESISDKEVGNSCCGGGREEKRRENSAFLRVAVPNEADEKQIAENNNGISENVGTITPTDKSNKVPAFHCEQQVIVSASVDNALEEQQRVVYDPESTEQDRERGGLVLRDGSVNPGHFCFDIDCRTLSPISQCKASCGGAVRVGDCSQVSAGWDHDRVLGNDPSTHHHANLVYAHFHCHADNVNLRACRLGQKIDSSSINPISHTMPPTYASAPSLGDLGAWLGYHRNMPRAFVLTRTTSWLLFKWQVPGHDKNGMECPTPIVNPWIQECQARCYDSITSLWDKNNRMLQEMPTHGFSIYTRSLFDHSREPEEDGIYRLWDLSSSSAKIAPITG